MPKKRWSEPRKLSLPRNMAAIAVASEYLAVYIAYTKDYRAWRLSLTSKRWKATLPERRMAAMVTAYPEGLLDA